MSSEIGVFAFISVIAFVAFISALWKWFGWGTSSPTSSSFSGFHFAVVDAGQCEIGDREKPERGEECEQPHRRGQGQQTNEIGFRKGFGHVGLG